MCQNCVPSALQGLVRAANGYEGIAVAVPSNPRPEGKHLRDLLRAQILIVDVAKRFAHFHIQTRQAIEDGHRIVIKSHANFVRHQWLLYADFVSLPKREHPRAREADGQGLRVTARYDAAFARPYAAPPRLGAR